MASPMTDNWRCKEHTTHVTHWPRRERLCVTKYFVVWRSNSVSVDLGLTCVVERRVLGSNSSSGFLVGCYTFAAKGSGTYDSHMHSDMARIASAMLYNSCCSYLEIAA